MFQIRKNIYNEKKLIIKQNRYFKSFLSASLIQLIKP